MIVMGVFAIFVFVYAERVGRSPLGRTLKAVRESEDAARSLGKDDTAYRRKILIVASAIAGIVGALYSFQIAAVTYDTWTRFVWTFWPFLIIIIGGVGNNVGVAVGAFFFALVYKGLLQVQPYLQPYLGGVDPNWLTYLLFASMLILILYFRPEGLVPEKSSPTLSRGKLKSIVASEGLDPEGGATGKQGRVRRLFSRVMRRNRGTSQKSEPPAK